MPTALASAAAAAYTDLTSSRSNELPIAKPSGKTCHRETWRRAYLLHPQVGDFQARLSERDLLQLVEILTPADETS